MTRVGKVGADKLGADKLGADKLGADKLGADKIAPDKAAPDQPKSALTELAELAGEWVQVVEAATAGLVAAEMAAIQAALAPQVTLSPEAKAAKALSDEEKAEDGFDNMPL